MMRRYLTILLLALLPLVGFGQGYDGTAITGTNINLSGTSWGINSNSDSPEGAWYILDAGATTTTATITLPTTLAAGTWRWQFKFIDYDQFATATITFGSGSDTAAVSDRDTSRWLEEGVDITSSYGTNKVTVRLDVVGPAFIKARLLAMYYTTNLLEDVDPGGKDLIWTYAYPGSTSTNVTSTDNLLSTSSFEGGLGDWRPSVTNRREPLYNYLSHTDAQHGDSSLKIPETTDPAGNSITVHSPFFYVREDSRNYNISLYYKGSGSVRVKSAATVPSWATAVYDTTVSLPSVGSWTRTNFSAALPDYPVGAPYVVILGGASNTLFDAIQVVEGTNAITFATHGNFELGWSNTVPANVYYTNSTSLKPYLVAHNTSGGTRSMTIKYEFVNHWNETVLSGTVDNSFDNDEYLYQAITLPTQPGWYRAVAWTDGVEPVETTIVHMGDPGSSQSDFIGTHPYPRAWLVGGLERLGISWGRAMSPDANTRWYIGGGLGAEETDDVFQFRNSLYSISQASNIVTVALLGAASASSVPSYAGSWSSTTASYWTNHADIMVGNYWATNSLIQYWEIFNEPQQGSMPVANYTNLVFTGAPVIRARGGKTVVMGGSSTVSYITTTLDSLGTAITNYVDVISIHGYPEDSDPFSSGPPLEQAAGWKTNILDVYGTPNGIPLWNTESGQWDWGGAMNASRYRVVGGGVYRYAHQRPTFDGLVSVPWQISRHALAYKTYGFERYFYYDSRITTDGEWYENYTSSWEGDGGHRPKLAALGVINSLVAGTTGAGLLPTSNGNVVFLYFENGTSSRAAVWSTNAAHFTLTSTNVTPYDWMGAAKTVTANQYTIGRMPTYILPSGGISSATFKSHLTNSTITSASDTFAPGLTIYQFPGSTANTNVFWPRWTVLDEYSLPGKNNQTDLLSRSKISVNASGYTADTYSDWSTDIERIWTGLASASFTLTVQAKDAAGNITTQTRSFGDAAAQVAAQLSGSATLSGAVRIGP